MKNKKSIYETHQKLIDEEWDFEKNNELGLDPMKITHGSHQKVWWKCKKEHKWETSCSHRTINNRGCPYCAGQKVCKDNCLSNICPELAKEWHPAKNGILTAKDVTCGSDKKIWWKCKKGHEWSARCCERTIGKGCPYCAGKKVCKDNCLLNKNPKIDSEWDYEKNNELGLDPSKIFYSSYKKAWWKCEKGHKWKASINSRNKGVGCPYCAKSEVCKDNCLSLTHPELTKEWNYKKNNELGLSPTNITSGSNKKVWWVCSRGHEWEVSPNERSRQYKQLKSKLSKSKKSNCPYCSGRKICSDNCLSVTHPELSIQWNYSRNGELTPQDVGFGCVKKVWWKCSEGHEWEAVIGSRSWGNRCPKCAIKRRFGASNNNYNPNLTDDNREKNKTRTSDPVNRAWRTKVYKRDNYTCQICHKIRHCNAHHLMGYDKYVELRLNVDNGITLCETCHDNFHHIYGWGNNTLQQFKEHIININNELLTLSIFEKLNILEEYILNNNIKPRVDHFINYRI